MVVVQLEIAQMFGWAQPDMAEPTQRLCLLNQAL